VKFRTERDGLLDALVTAGRASAARVGMGLGTQGVRLVVHGDQLELTGSDPDLVIEVTQNVSGEQDGSALLPSRLVTDIIRAFDAGTVTLEGNEQEVRITSGRAEFVVRVATGAEITRLAPVESKGITLPAVPFGEGLRQVIPRHLTMTVGHPS